MTGMVRRKLPSHTSRLMMIVPWMVRFSDMGWTMAMYLWEMTREGVRNLDTIMYICNWPKQFQFIPHTFLNDKLFTNTCNPDNPMLTLSHLQGNWQNRNILSQILPGEPCYHFYMHCLEKTGVSGGTKTRATYLKLVYHSFVFIWCFNLVRFCAFLCRFLDYIPNEQARGKKQ